MLYWSALPNPFSRLATQSLLESPTEKTTDTSEIITGHVSGRRSDIIDIVTGVQSAILMTGASQIGKSTLLRYLARPPQSEWSWRDELQTCVTNGSLTISISSLLNCHLSKRSSAKMTCFWLLPGSVPLDY